MNLFINGYPIEFEIENEKEVKEVVSLLEKWATDRYLIFTEVIIDGEKFIIEEIPVKKIDKVENLDCLMHSKAEVIVSSLTEGIAYCDRVKAYIDEAKESEKFQISELEFLYSGLEWLRDMTEKVFSLVNLKVDEIKYMDKSVEVYLNQIDSLKNDLSGIKDEPKVLSYLFEKKDFFDIFRGIFKLILISENLKDVIIKSIDSPDVLINALKDIKSNFEKQLDFLQNASEAFQSGNDQEGAENINKFIDFIYLYTRTCYQIIPVFNLKAEDIVVDDVSLDEKNSEINQYLEELIDIMENNDIISLSDLLEYEIKPGIENLDGYIDKILEKC